MARASIRHSGFVLRVSLHSLYCSPARAVDNPIVMSVILIGYRGCGKTTVGKRLADRLWQKFVDTDELVVKASQTAAKIRFVEDAALLAAVGGVGAFLRFKV